MNVFFKSRDLWSIPYRTLHRSASYSYAKLWRGQRIDYLREMQRENIQHFPHLIERIMKVESAMKRNGLTSFVHAAPAGSSVLRAAYDVFYGKRRFFQFLRSRRDSYQTPWQLPQIGDRAQTPHLISMSYALTSSVKCMESAASWGFVNHFGSEVFFPLLREYEIFLNAVLKERSETIAWFRHKGMRLIREYAQLNVGDFIVIGVPKTLLSKYVYDSSPYNVPTGREVAEVANTPSAHMDTLKEHGHMATMVICEETLDPTSGIVMVRAHNAEEVAAFCENKHFLSMQKLPLLYKLFCFHSSTLERREEQNRMIADQKLAELTNELMQAYANPYKIFDIKKLDLNNLNPMNNIPFIGSC